MNARRVRHVVPSKKPRTDKHASEAPTLPPPPPDSPEPESKAEVSAVQKKRPARQPAAVEEVTADLSRDPRRER